MQRVDGTTMVNTSMNSRSRAQASLGVKPCDANFLGAVNEFYRDLPKQYAVLSRREEVEYASLSNRIAVIVTVDQYVHVKRDHATRPGREAVRTR